MLRVFPDPENSLASNKLTYPYIRGWQFIAVRADCIQPATPR